MKPNTPEGRAMAEKFNAETPNPLNLPFDEYLQTMTEQENLEQEIKLIEDTRFLSAKQVEIYKMNSSRIQATKEDIRNETVTSRNPVTGLSETREASPADIQNMKGQIRRLELSNEQLLEKPRGMETFFTIGLDDQRRGLENDIQARKALLPRQREIMGDSEYQERLNMIAEKEQQLKLVTAEIQDFGREKADEEIENVKEKAGNIKVETKIKKDEEKNPFVVEIKKELRSKEGLELKAYKPVPTEKQFTIGYGHYGEDVKKDMVITKARAEELLHEDVMSRLDQVKNLIPDFVTFSEDQQKAIFTEYFRGSITGSPTAVKFINSKEYAKAAAEYLDNDEYRYARQRGKPGIRPRMEAVANALLELDKETYPEKYENQNNDSLLSRVTDIFN